MSDLINPDLAHVPGSIEVRKKPGIVQVRFADQAGIVATLEGRVAYQPGDALITGASGETWPVSEAYFQNAYRPSPPTLYGKDGLYEKKPLKARALQRDEAFSIVIASGETLCGKAGDWLVQYESGECGIVAQALFATLYERL